MTQYWLLETCYTTLYGVAAHVRICYTYSNWFCKFCTSLNNILKLSLSSNKSKYVPRIDNGKKLFWINTQVLILWEKFPSVQGVTFVATMGLLIGVFRVIVSKHDLKHSKFWQMHVSALYHYRYTKKLFHEIETFDVRNILCQYKRITYQIVLVDL